MMKIAYILPSLTKAGPNIVVHTLISNLVSSPEFKIGNIDVFYFDEKDNLLEFPCRTIKITPDESIAFDDYDIIHSHGYRPDKYLYKFKNVIRKAKTVTTIHQDIYQYFAFAYNKIIASVFTPLWIRYIRSLDAAVPISGKVHSLYQKKLANLKEKIYNGVDLCDTLSLDENAALKISDLKNKGLQLVASYSNITRIKGLEQLIELAAARKDIGLVIIGEGKEKDNLIALATKRNISDRVLFIPFLPEPYKYLKLVDIYAMPSRSEGFGLALVEGVLSKTPVIASDIDIFHELFTENEISFFKLDDIQSLEEALNYATLNSRNLCDRAFRYAIDHYTGRVMAINYYDLYAKILNS